MSDRPEKRPDDGNDLIMGGVGVGAIGVVGAVVLGATCPICVVATPALIGAGLFQKWRARRIAALQVAKPEEEQPAP